MLPTETKRLLDLIWEVKNHALCLEGDLEYYLARHHPQDTNNTLDQISKIRLKLDKIEGMIIEQEKLV